MEKELPNRTTEEYNDNSYEPPFEYHLPSHLTSLSKFTFNEEDFPHIQIPDSVEHVEINSNDLDSLLEQYIDWNHFSQYILMEGFVDEFFKVTLPSNLKVLTIINETYAWHPGHANGTKVESKHFIVGLKEKNSLIFLK